MVVRMRPVMGPTLRWRLEPGRNITGACLLHKAQNFHVILHEHSGFKQVGAKNRGVGNGQAPALKGIFMLTHLSYKCSQLATSSRESTAPRGWRSS